MRSHTASISAGVATGARARPATSLAASASRWSVTIRRASSRSRSHVDRRQLQQQAFARRCAPPRRPVRATARGLQRDLQFVERGRRVELGDLDQLGQIDAQIAVVVERLDDRFGQHQIAQRQRQHVELAVQMLSQRRLDRHHVHQREVALLARGACSNSRRPASSRARASAIGGRARSPQRPRSQRRRDGVDTRLRRFGGRSASGSSPSRNGFPPERLVHLLCEVERRKLQQPHGLLQAGRQRLLLPALDVD